jgi:predicted transcriptional regulator
MYHTERISQAPQIKKSFNQTSFSEKDSQTDHYTNADKQITSIILNSTDHRVTVLTNEYLSSVAGCSTKTVTRATNKLHKNGLITKHQPNDYGPNYYTLNDELYRSKKKFPHWINSLSDHNQYLYVTHGIRIDHDNKTISQFEYVQPKNSLLLDNNLFINLSPNAHVRVRDLRVFKKTKEPERQRWNQKKGNIMDNFQNQPPDNQKLIKKRRNDGGHSPMVVKPVLPLADQIHSKKVDIAFFTKQLQEPETFWDPHGILFSAQLSMVKSLLARAHFELIELENQRKSNEKQSVLREYSPNSMETCSA